MKPKQLIDAIEAAGCAVGRTRLGGLISWGTMPDHLASELLASEREVSDYMACEAAGPLVAPRIKKRSVELGRLAHEHQATVRVAMIEAARAA